VREVDAPSGFRVGRRVPPQVLVVGSLSEIGLCAECARGRRRELLSRDRFHLRDAVDRIRERSGIASPVTLRCPQKLAARQRDRVSDAATREPGER